MFLDGVPAPALHLLLDFGARSFDEAWMHCGCGCTCPVVLCFDARTRTPHASRKNETTEHEKNIN